VLQFISSLCISREAAASSCGPARVDATGIADFAGGFDFMKHPSSKEICSFILARSIWSALFHEQDRHLASRHDALGDAAHERTSEKPMAVRAHDDQLRAVLIRCSQDLGGW